MQPTSRNLLPAIDPKESRSGQFPLRMSLRNYPYFRGLGIQCTLIPSTPGSLLLTIWDQYYNACIRTSSSSSILIQHPVSRLIGFRKLSVAIRQRGILCLEFAFRPLGFDLNLSRAHFRCFRTLPRWQRHTPIYSLSTATCPTTSCLGNDASVLALGNVRKD